MSASTRQISRGKSLVDTVVDALREKIAQGSLEPGSRLLSIRKAAAEFGVSKNTIIEAFDRLAASGHVTPRARSGFVVNDSGLARNGARPRHVTEAIDIASLLSAQLEQTFSIRVGDGRPPASWTEHSEIKRHLGANGKALPVDADAYGSPLGFLPLRQQVARRLAAQQIQAREENILLTFGANHALDLVIRALLSPGDTVLVDEPGYYPLFAKLKLAQVRMVGVRRAPEGPELEDFHAKAAAERPKLFFTQSLGHNPTGGSTTAAVAHAILTLATRYGLTIVEDDPFADLPTTPDVRLATLDQLNNVISVGTFSKTLSASLRSGFIAARPDRIAALAELKMLTTVNSSGHVERFLHRLLVEGHYDRHLKRLAQRIEVAASQTLTKLERMGCRVYSKAIGGYYLYVLLPSVVDDLELGKEGAKESIFIAPGSVFCLDKGNHLAKGIRINVARADDPRFYDFLLRKLN
ncbi:MAG TPA: PLP-dependent aminotransferase family protein [Roseiarcus sp.]|nr:PLP-dependent aminotransferase family protein [Roseiarcus sp.]